MKISNEIKIWLDPSDILDYEMMTDSVIYSKDWGKVNRKS